MDYFLITQDKRISNIAKLAGVSKISSNPDEIEPEHFFLKEQDENIYVDFIERPVPMVSDKLKQLLKRFDQRCVFTPVVFSDIKHCTQQLYWRLNPLMFRCLANDMEFDKDKTLKKLTLNVMPPADLRVFQVGRIVDSLIFVNLIVLESMLRRGLTGFKFTKIELAARN